MKPTREQILEANLDQLDLWISEYVFGHKAWSFNQFGEWKPVTYTRSIYKAWQIVEKLANVYVFRLTNMGAGNKKWRANFEHICKTDTRANGETAPIAIGRASLLVVLEE